MVGLAALINAAINVDKRLEERKSRQLEVQKLALEIRRMLREEELLRAASQKEDAEKKLTEIAVFLRDFQDKGGEVLLQVPGA